MQQIDTPDGLFHDGSPSTGELGTIVSADWLNSVARELENVVTGLGGSLDPARNDQIKSLLVEKLASKHNAVLTGTPVAPTAEVGTATDQLATTGFVSKAIGKNTGLPLLFPLWCPNRAAIPAGYAPADGQALSRSLYPEAWAGIAAGNVPVATDAAWLATPTERGKFTAGDGSTTFRLPDYNGKSAGSLGAVFMRGDGMLSAGADGVIQPDEIRSHVHPLSGRTYSALSTGISNGGAGSGVNGYLVTVAGESTALPAGGVETRPLNITGCWVIRLFGAVVNPGAADAAQLATEVSKLGADKVALTAFLGANQSLATSGYQMLPGGLILQWGTTPVLSTTLTSVAFPIAFPSACRSVALTNSTGTNINVGATNITAAKFDGYASGGGNVHRYIAIGI
ncbi:hypothetical protein DAI18_01535 [Microvirgula aerodenitrificans]|uniref:Putative tail fiber protein gp53-like C-terminal domain-containing protein n=1 Tax=Microvirgula aerodenitrificans TaxID=57480 RepID=A0A2U3THH5_9NEIS|nr:phage tail protein [Microvirgula aerodenitrificans]AVY92867.1 hypothetical protein DAI18_01535 [Microvirgula aerodenitrificans]